MSAQRLGWDDLRYVLAIGREGSLSGAARRLNVNHATVFRRLKAMEDDIGVRLFERQAEGYVATPAGEEAIAVAGALDESVAALERRIIGQDLRPSGTVRISTVEALLLELMPDMVRRFRTAHPEITLELIMNPAAANLSRRDADIAIRVTHAPPDYLIGRRIAVVASAVYAAPEYLDAAPPLDDLAVHQWVGYDEALAHLKAARFLKHLLNDRAPCMRVNQVMTVKKLVEAGVGLGFMPCFMGDVSGKVRRILRPSPEWNSELWLLTHPDLRHVARVRAVMDHFGEELTRLRPLFEGALGRNAATSDNKAP